MVPFYHRDKIALIAFGGNKKEPCNKVKQTNFFYRINCRFEKKIEV
jgi:hypothetical protein